MKPATEDMAMRHPVNPVLRALADYAKTRSDNIQNIKIR
jgi:hypothetical protein